MNPHEFPEKENFQDTVEIFTDGACKGNPGPGGWGVLMRFRGVEKSISGGEAWTTNNRMEMIAAIKGFESLKRPCKVRITTDSQYLMFGITKWMKNWKKRNWMTSTNTPVKNADLWKRLEAAMAPHKVEWEWTRGHSGHPENHQVDTLAREAIKQFSNKP